MNRKVAAAILYAWKLKTENPGMSKKNIKENVTNWVKGNNIFSLNGGNYSVEFNENIERINNLKINVSVSDITLSEDLLKSILPDTGTSSFWVNLWKLIKSAKISENTIDTLEISMDPIFIMYSFNPNSYLLKLLNNSTQNPVVIIIGRQGAGKTTFCGRLCDILVEKNDYNDLAEGAVDLCGEWWNERNIESTPGVFYYEFPFFNRKRIHIFDTQGWINEGTIESQATAILGEINDMGIGENKRYYLVFMWDLTEEGEINNVEVLGDVIHKYLEELENTVGFAISGFSGVFFILNKGDYLNDNKEEQIKAEFEKIIKNLGIKDLDVEILWDNGRVFAFNPPEGKGRTSDDSIRNQILRKFECYFNCVEKLIPSIGQIMTKYFGYLGEHINDENLLDTVNNIRNVHTTLWGKYMDSNKDKEEQYSYLFLTSFIATYSFLKIYMENGSTEVDESFNELARIIEEGNLVEGMNAIINSWEERENVEIENKVQIFTQMLSSIDIERMNDIDEIAYLYTRGLIRVYELITKCRYSQQ